MSEEEIRGYFEDARTGRKWKDLTIEADAYTALVRADGFVRKTIQFVASAAGTLTVEIDVVGDGDWRTLATASITADTPWTLTTEAIFFTMRLKFSAAATVWAKYAMR